jgi:hypothetical protein
MFNAIKHTAHPQGRSTIAEGIAVGTPGASPAHWWNSMWTTWCWWTKATSSKPS